MKFEVLKVDNEFFGGHDYVLQCTQDDGVTVITYVFEDDKYPTEQEIEEAKNHTITVYPYLVFCMNRV